MSEKKQKQSIKEKLMEKLNPMQMMAGVPSLMGDPIEILKANLPKTVNLKITFAIVADPDDKTKQAFAIILRENK